MNSILSVFSTKAALGISSALLAFGVLTPAASQAATFVDTELYLAVDDSGSINNSEFNLQKQGYVDAFKDTAIQALIEAAPNGIAVAYGYWAGPSSQQTAVTSTLLKTAADAVNFANLIDATTRPFGGSTAPGNAIQFAANELLNNMFDGTKLVIDVSGDGSQNSGISTSGARDAAVAAGIDTINGITVSGGTSVFNFYQDNVQAGADGFTLQATGFDTFGSAIKTKIFRELGGGGDPVTSVPEPASLLGLGMLAAAGAVSAKKRKSLEA